jgi:hypothetical protein
LRKTSPTQRTLAHLRDDGWLTAVVEKWNAHAKIRQDLYGFVDVLALRGAVTLAVQCTSSSHVASRVTKIAEHPNTAAVRAAGWQIVVHGWRKNSKGHWVLRVVDVS